jgi:hypothetical protein
MQVQAVARMLLRLKRPPICQAAQPAHIRLRQMNESTGWSHPSPTEMRKSRFERHTYESRLDYPDSPLFPGDVTQLCAFERLRGIGERRGLQSEELAKKA